MIRITRRRFITLSSGLVVAGCTTDPQLSLPGSTVPTSTTPPPGTVPRSTAPGSTAPTTTSPEAVVTTVATDDGVLPSDRVLVMVELAGGNDALNTLPPLGGPYQALRPSLSLNDDEMIDGGLGDYALHAALRPLVPLIDAGRLAVVAGIGFDDPDRSHFVSMDRWMRADRMDEQVGWLGRWLDHLPADLPSLGATAVGGGGGRILLGAERRAR